MEEIVEVIGPVSDSDKGDKTPKSDVDYSRGSKAEHCGVCKHYTWAGYDVPVCDGRCSLVEGYIDPAYWCERFTSSKSSEK